MSKPKKDTDIEKYYLNLAGEYRVCAELLKRNIFATITLANMKGVDVIAVGPSRRAAMIEVKASNSSRFVTSLYQKYKTQDCEHPAFWVLYSITCDAGIFTDRFFVLTHDELARAQSMRNGRGKKLTYSECAERFAKGVDNVLLADVQQFEDQWSKIVNYCSE